jgi:DNA polymerase III gamma/tau subunit
MNTTQQISTLAQVSIDKAQEIHDVLLTEALIDFSEATAREYKKAISLATWFIDNGRSWE